MSKWNPVSGRFPLTEHVDDWRPSLQHTDMAISISYHKFKEGQAFTNIMTRYGWGGEYSTVCSVLLRLKDVWRYLFLEDASTISLLLGLRGSLPHQLFFISNEMTPQGNVILVAFCVFGCTHTYTHTYTQNACAKNLLGCCSASSNNQKRRLLKLGLAAPFIPVLSLLFLFNQKAWVNINKTGTLNWFDATPHPHFCSPQDNYTFAQPGIQRKVKALEELVSRIDGESSALLAFIHPPPTHLQTPFFHSSSALTRLLHICLRSFSSFLWSLHQTECQPITQPCKSYK